MTDSTTTPINNRIIFSTKNITNIQNKSQRIQRHFILLNQMEKTMFNDYKIAHKGIYVELDNGKLYLMDFSLLYFNCIMWLFNISYGVKIFDDDLYDLSSATKGSFTSIMDKIISKFLKLGYNLDNFNIGIIKEKIINIAIFYGEIYANTFSLYDIMAFESRSPEFSELFNKPLDPNMSSNEIEMYLSLATEKFYKLVSEDKQSNLYPYMSTDMIKKLQIEQMFIGVGSRQDIDKSILPVIIKQGWVHGMKTNSEFYVESVSTRNSIIVKKEAVPDSGYLSRKVNISCLYTHLDSRIYDCGTTHYLSYLIQNEAHLKILEGKYMLIDPNGPILQDISITDTHLIGQVIKIRSHTKCITGHKVGKVCCICLGNKHLSLKNARIGGLVSIKLINPITQLGMSAKHAQSTKSEEISGDVIDKYFSVSRSNIYPKRDTTGKLLIKLEIVNDIISSECSVDAASYEDGLDFTKNIDMILVADNGILHGLDIEDKNFYVSISDNLTSVISNHANEIIHIDDIVNSTINIETTNDVTWEGEFQGNEYIALNLSDLDISEPIFTTKILTEEVSRHLKNTKCVIDGCKTITYTKPEDMINDFIEILFKAGLKTKDSLIHIETLVMNLMRSAEDLLERPDFSKKKEPKIQFIKLTQAIQKSDTFSTLCFQDIGRQLELSDTLRKRSSGIFDCFFRSTEFFKNEAEFRVTRPYLFDKNK